MNTNFPKDIELNYVVPASWLKSSIIFLNDCMHLERVTFNNKVYLNENTKSYFKHRILV